MQINEVSNKLLIPRHNLDYWKTSGLLSDADELTFLDLVKARFIFSCRSHGISLQSIREHIQSSPGLDKEWHSRVYVDPSNRILEMLDDTFYPIETKTSQLHFNFSETEANNSVSLTEYRDTRNENSSKKDETNEKEFESFVKDERYLKALASGSFNQLEGVLKSVLQEYPHNLAALIEIGNLYCEHSKFKNAQKYYEKALLEHKGCVEALYNLANIHLREKRYAVAIRYYRDCIAIDARFPEVYYNLGLLLFSLNYKEQAIECMEQYCQLDPDSEWGVQAAQLLEDLQQNSSLEASLVTKDEQTLFPIR